MTKAEAIMDQIEDAEDERIIAMGKSIDRLGCEQALMRQHMDSGFAALRQYIDSAIGTLRLEMQLYVQAELQKAVDKLTARIEAAEGRQAGFNRWMIGLLVTILLGQAALLAHALLG
jgi:hypothetical protein